MWSLSWHQCLGGCWGYHHCTQPRGFTIEEPQQYECHAEVRGQGAGVSQGRGEQSSVLDGMEPVMCPCFPGAAAGRTLGEQCWWSTLLQEELRHVFALQVWGQGWSLKVLLAWSSWNAALSRAGAGTGWSVGVVGDTTVPWVRSSSRARMRDSLFPGA